MTPTAAPAVISFKFLILNASLMFKLNLDRGFDLIERVTRFANGKNAIP